MNKKMFIFLNMTMLVVLLYAQKPSASDSLNSAKGWTFSFNVDHKNFSDTGRNRYFILEPDYYLQLEGREGKTKINLVIEVTNEKEVIEGVNTRIVEERESHNGELVEVSKNFYAIDKFSHSIFYFGEEVDIYKRGKIISHNGTWRSGEDGAKFGLMMPGLPLIGARYYQEMAEGVAMDRAKVVSISETVETPAGRFENCLKVEETTPLEPDMKEYKYYAPEIGLIKDGSLRLVKYGFKKRRSEMDRIGPQSSAERKQEQDIEALLKISSNLDYAWSRCDASAFAGLFDREADFSFLDGELIQGQEQIEQYLKNKVFKRSSEFRWQSSFMKKIRFITDNVAIGDGIIRVVEKSGSEEQVWLEANVTVITVKKGDDWFISALRLTKRTAK